ncbi:hypothetical protein [Marinobacter sp. CHS3-4]|uniref:hypothetical protein n=1 Tax=Marinobacter sp. CHS3-4 TaxID=3045174 RepID=UPI0024B59815|nr:hypothetical protein [Marinobacter sp. CHS3-4]MDI9245413.1 hypothetical protein [Marinobacter sp. CHS3-4]
MSSLIILLELGLFALLLLLAFRVLSLTRNEPLIPATPTEVSDAHHSYIESRMAQPASKSSFLSSPFDRQQAMSRSHDKCELISRLHILTSLQIRDCKEQDLEIETAHLAVREYAVCWLYGAACALSGPTERNSEELARLVSQFASRKAGIRQSEAMTVIATITRQSSFLSCFRGGIEGAEFWKSHHFVPREKSLFEAVTSNTFV